MALPQDNSPSAPAMGLLIPKNAQLAVINYHTQCFTLMGQQYNLREQLRQMDLAYMRENNLTAEQQRAKLSNKYGDSTRYQDITVPIVLPAVESAVTYQTSVFLTGYPMFGVVSDPNNEDAALQMESVIGENSIKGGWVGQIQQVMRDGFKYNLGASEISWKKQTVASFETDTNFSKKQARPVDVIWEGNAVKKLDLYNTFWDTRVKPTEVHSKGEFAGYNEIMSRIELKKFINELEDKIVDNVTAAFESGSTGTVTGSPGSLESYFVPLLNPSAVINNNPRASTDWMAWAGLAGSEQKIEYRNIYEVTTLYAKILPADFGLKVPSRNTPQIWKFIIVNHNVLIYAERQINAHNYLPILFIQPLEDGLGYQTKSLADNSKPFQEVSSAMMASIMGARRRAISDRGIYDPSRISEKHINSGNPSAKIPVKPAAYGKPLSEAYFPIPFRDDQSAIMFQQLPIITRMADIVNGQNPAKQGQFVKGNKTLEEYQNVMDNANGRDQSVSLLLEAQYFTPFKEIIRSNILQFQGATDIFNYATKTSVTVDPVQLRKAVIAFKITDGLLPTDKIINGQDLQAALQALSTNQNLGAGYNLAPMFSYLMKTRGVELTEFEKPPEQLAYEQAIGAWQQNFQLIAAEVATLIKAAQPEALSQLMKDFSSMLPPQPNPKDFGYNPGGTPQKGAQQQ